MPSIERFAIWIDWSTSADMGGPRDGTGIEVIQ